LPELIRRVLRRLEEECRATGKQPHYELFRQRLVLPTLEGAEPPLLSELAQRLNMSEKQAANYLLTARRACQRILREEIRSFAGSEEEVAKEINDLFRFFCESDERTPVSGEHRATSLGSGLSAATDDNNEGNTMRPSQGVALGIDLGSVASSMAWATPEGQVQVISNGEGDPTTPSVIDFSEYPPVVGKAAWKRRFADVPEVVMMFRTSMGENRLHRFRDRDWTAVDMEALLLAKMRRDAEAALQRPVKGAVIGIPAYLAAPQTASYREAALLAGFEEIQLIQEPVAVALAYMKKHRLTEGVYLIYDLSAATFDATLFRVDDDTITVMAIGGDRYLGTIDWIPRIAVWISERVGQDKASVPADHPEGFGRFTRVAELLNEAMYSRSEARFSLDDKTELTFTRVEFE
jgi:Hsp70 protein